ncbi:MAG: hypothetical protein ACK55Z_08825, partial [bacterium]
TQHSPHVACTSQLFMSQVTARKSQQTSSTASRGPPALLLAHLEAVVGRVMWRVRASVRARCLMSGMCGHPSSCPSR